MSLRRSFVYLPLMAMLGCAQVSGLTEFDLEASGGADGAGGAGGTGAGVTSGGGGSGGQPVATGPFEDIQPVAALMPPATDDDPTFTADGLELYFNTFRGGGTQIWRSERSNLGDDWGAPTPAEALSVGTYDSNGVVSPDGSTFWLIVQDPDRIHVSRRSGSVWAAPELDTQQPNPQFGFVGAVTSDELRMVYEADGSLYEATRDTEQGDWSPPSLIMALGNSDKEPPWMSPDGLHLYWSASGSIFRATRSSVEDGFESPDRVSELDQAGVLSDPWLTPDQSYIMFTVGVGQQRRIFEARRPAP